MTHLIVLALWFLVGYSLAASVGADQSISIQAGLFTFTGAIFFVLGVVLPNPRLRRIFLEGPRPDEDGEAIIGCYNFIPAAIIFIALIIWLIRTIISL